MNKFFFLLSVPFFLACGEQSKQVNSPSSSSIVQVSDTIEIINQSDEYELKALADSLELSEGKYDDLLREKTSNDRKTRLYYRKIHLQQMEIDSLNSLVNGLTTVNHLINEKYEEPPLTDKEKQIQQMVYNMHKDWKRLTVTKDPDLILAYFNDQFAISRITIESNNTAQIARYSQTDFKDYLKRFSKEKGLSFEFGNVKFLDMKIQNDAYFNVSYKCILRLYKDDKLFESSQLLVTITGKNDNGKWGIASYSWVGFKTNH
jgi:hypothetical protein